MAEEKSIADRVRALIAEQMGKPVEEITPEKSFEDLGGDSLDALEALMGVEEALNVRLDDEVISMASTVGDLIAQVEKAHD